MGWCGGTEVFDGVLDAVLPNVDDPARVDAIVERVAEILWDGDWDCEADSKYYEKYLLPLMKKRGYVDEDDDWDDFQL